MIYKINQHYKSQVASYMNIMIYIKPKNSGLIYKSASG